MRSIKVMDEVGMEEREVLTDYLADTVYEIEDLTIPHDIKGFEIEEANVKAITEENILIKATGRVEVHLRNDEYAYDRDDAGMEMDAEFPFDATFRVEKTAELEDLMVESVEFHVNTEEPYD